VGAGRLPFGLGLVGLPVLFIILALLPLVERSGGRSLAKRPVALVLAILFLLLLMASWLAGMGGGGAPTGGGVA
jgi:quinol-cytochrome oxidoreductase complex cytochrome b subunit